MAEATLPIFLGKMKDILVGQIKDYVVSPIGRQFTYMFDFNNNIEKLQSELEELQRTRDFVQREVNEGRRPRLGVSGLDAVAWLSRVNEVTNQVEGIIRDKAKVKEGCLNGFWPDIKLRYSVSREAVKNTKVVVDLEAAGFDYVKSAYRIPQVENFRALKSQMLNIEEIREKNFKALNSQMLTMEEIIKDLTHDQIDLIGICGMTGVGKTTMAKEVAKRAKENKLFDEVAMAMVGQYPNLSKVQASIAGMLGLKLGDPENPVVRATLLHQRLLQDNKKILVILDDTWAEFDLHTIGIPLGGANKNVKILYTSRVRDLWRELQTKKEIPLDLLSDDEAWELFKEKAGDLVDDKDLQPIARQIVNECECLPLALVLIGSTLLRKSWGIFIKRTWEKMLNELTCLRSTPAKNPLSSSLELSYNYIEDEEARRLFLLCCFVEEEKSIHIEDLVRYAWGLSLFPGANTVRKVRHQVSALVDDLKRRYLLLDNENDKCVEVHDVVRDMGISIASKDKGVLVCHGAVFEWPKEDTYEHYTSMSVISDIITELPERWTCPNLEFLLLECCKVEKLPSNFFEGVEKLKVLGLNNFDGILTLQSLRNLRTLSLTRFGGVLDNVSVMGGLVNLEILNFHGSSIKELPEEIGDLVNLRLLDLGDTWSLDRIPRGVISRLVCLEELYIFDSKFSEWEGEVKEEEGRNANLREFESLSNLNTLEIRIRCDVLIPEVPIFSKLTTYKVLIGDTGEQCRHIDQYKTKLIVSASSPIPSDRAWFDLLLRSADCVILEGEGCKDMVQDLLLRDGFHGLQQLKYLQISRCDTPECLANTMNLVQLPNEPAPAVFPILEQLKLSALPNLREICRGPAPAGSFGKLTDIDIDDCERLRHLFQLPIVRSLTQLKSLSIMQCYTMEEVIWEEQREDVHVVIEFLDFPKLETLVLDNLPSLVGFGREINRTDFRHAKCLRLRHLRHLQCLFANNHGFLSLFPQKVTFPSLELLELQGLQNLGDVWGSELFHFSFSKLKELEVEDCGSLTDLFHPSMAGILVNLQKLVIKNCHKMNSVVGREEEIEDGQGRAIEKTLFPQLIVLELHRLPNLRRFCYFTHPIESWLRRIYISDCPSMDAFSLGNVSAPNLSLPGVSWNGNLNNAIQLLQEMSTTATEGAPQSHHQVLPTPLESQQSFTMKMSTTVTEGGPQSQQVPPTLLESQQDSTMKMPTTATERAPLYQQQVPPTPLESQHPSTMKMSTTEIEGASHWEQQVPPFPLKSQQPSTLKISTTATEGAPQSEHQSSSYTIGISTAFYQEETERERMDDPKLPGFGFYPTEEELVSFYLKEKIRGGKREELINRVIPVLYIYEFNPWELPQFAGEPCQKDPEQWFFFVPRQEKEVRGGRPNRLTTMGFWKATGSPGYVYSSDNQIIGWKRTMVFYEGRAPTGKKTQWKMTEYTAIDGEFASSSLGTSPQISEEFSLCRVYLKPKCLRAFDRRPSSSSSSATTSIAIVNQAHDHHYIDPNRATSTCHDHPMMGRINTTSPDQSSSGDHANPNSQTLGTNQDSDNPYCEIGVDSNEDLWDILEQLDFSS